MTVFHSARQMARRLGFDVRRWPSGDPDLLANKALLSVQPELVVDIGAHVGGFASEIRRVGFDGAILSIEPDPASYGVLESAAQTDPNWDTVRLAISDHTSTALLHVAGNSGASSSLLPMTRTHLDAEPMSRYVGDERVQTRRLDELLDELAPQCPRIALKIDTQGFESQVLHGAEHRLGDVWGVRIELSLTSLYEGAWSWQEALDFLSHHGFAMVGVIPGFHDPRTSRLLQFDGVFVRET